jgi:hypothetical protein
MEISNYNTRRAELLELASYDDADSYEVDEGGIFYDLETGKIVVLTASGCSCWEGDGNEYVFDSLAEAEIALVLGDKDGNDVVDCPPGIERSKRLIEEARAKLPAKYAGDAFKLQKSKRARELVNELNTSEWLEYLGGYDHTKMIEVLIKYS